MEDKADKMACRGARQGNVLGGTIQEESKRKEYPERGKREEVERCNEEAIQAIATPQEWAILEPLIPPAKAGGHPRTTEMREVINAILYVDRTG
jgi:Putative transposase of IS4/5 family (DUF4096)